MTDGTKQQAQWIRESKPQATVVMAQGILNDLLGKDAKPGALVLLTARLGSWREAITGAALQVQPSTDPPAPGDEYVLDQSVDGLLRRIEDYRTGYSAGYADGKSGARMRDKDAAANFFSVSGVPDIAGPEPRRRLK